MLPLHTLTSTDNPAGCAELWHASLAEGVGPEPALCFATLEAFFAARVVYNAEDQFEDPWFSEATCSTAHTDGYDNTAFYNCCTMKFQLPANEVCEPGGGAVYQFEDLSQSGDPAGCVELYNSVLGDAVP